MLSEVTHWMSDLPIRRCLLVRLYAPDGNLQRRGTSQPHACEGYGSGKLTIRRRERLQSLLTSNPARYHVKLRQPVQHLRHGDRHGRHLLEVLLRLRRPEPRLRFVNPIIPVQHLVTNLWTAVVWFFFGVETRGRTLEELDAVFDSKFPPKASLAKTIMVKQGGHLQAVEKEGEV